MLVIKLLSEFIRLIDPFFKSEAHFQYKLCRNILSTLLKRSKQSHFTDYVQTNINYLRNTWKGIKNLISLKRSINSVPSAHTN